MMILKTIINSSIILFLAALLMFGICTRNSMDNDSRVTHIDTSLYIDTNWTYDTIRVYDTSKISIPVHVPIPQIIDTASDIVLYCDSSADEKVTIYWTDTVQGLLIGKSLQYTLHVPKEIIKTQTITNTQTITKTQESTHNKLYCNVTFGTKDYRLGLMFLPKNDRCSFTYDYNLINNSHNATIGYRLWKSH